MDEFVLRRESCARTDLHEKKKTTLHSLTIFAFGGSKKSKRNHELQAYEEQIYQVFQCATSVFDVQNDHRCITRWISYAA